MTLGNACAGAAHSNAAMVSLFRPCATHDSAALARYEALFQEWCVASDALVAAEIALWTHALRGPGNPCQTLLAADALARREAARLAQAKVRAALAEADDKRTPE